MRKCRAFAVLIYCAAAATPFPAAAKTKKHDVVFPKRTAPPTVSTRWLCESFEGAAAKQFTVCTAKERDEAPVNNLLSDIDRAKHQCMELLNGPLADKHLRIDAERARACTLAREMFLHDYGRTPTLYTGMLATCDLAIVGIRTKGQSCGSGLECTPGLACAGNRGEVFGPGTCVEMFAPGHVCSIDQVNASTFGATLALKRGACGQGHHCATGTLNSACVKSLTPGASCTGQDLDECGPGYRCSTDKCTIDARAESGAACKTSAECRGVCASGTCASLCGSG